MTNKINPVNNTYKLLPSDERFNVNNKATNPKIANKNIAIIPVSRLLAVAKTLTFVPVGLFVISYLFSPNSLTQVVMLIEE